MKVPEPTFAAGGTLDAGIERTISAHVDGARASVGVPAA